MVGSSDVDRETVVETLREVVAGTPRNAPVDPNALRGALLDRIGSEERATIELLVRAAQDGLIERLRLSAPHWSIRRAPEVDEVRRRLATTPELAAWTVDVWAEALGIKARAPQRNDEDRRRDRQHERDDKDGKTIKRKRPLVPYGIAAAVAAGALALFGPGAISTLFPATPTPAPTLFIPSAAPTLYVPPGLSNTMVPIQVGPTLPPVSSDPVPAGFHSLYNALPAVYGAVSDCRQQGDDANVGVQIYNGYLDRLYFTVGVSTLLFDTNPWIPQAYYIDHGTSKVDYKLITGMRCGQHVYISLKNVRFGSEDAPAIRL